MKLKRKLKKTRIAGGREIVPWVERLNYFNDYFRPEGFTLESSELQLLNDEYVCIRGFVKNKTGIVVADGIAFKKLIEPFSVQKCQSGALNRALFVFGIVDTGEETIMDESEAEELNRTTLSDIDQAYNNMKDYIKTDVKIVCWGLGDVETARVDPLGARVPDDAQLEARRARGQAARRNRRGCGGPHLRSHRL